MSRSPTVGRLLIEFVTVNSIIYVIERIYELGIFLRTDWEHIISYALLMDFVTGVLRN